MSAVTLCGSCRSGRLTEVLDVGFSPPTCVMPPATYDGPEKHYPLVLLECQSCSLVQLSWQVEPEVQFPRDYPYRSGTSRALREDFAELAAALGLSGDQLVVDIGANDGTLLRQFDCRTVGVEPTGQAERISGPYIRRFFSSAVAQQVLAVYGQADAVTACNVLAHVADIHDVIEGIHFLLKPGGVFVAENHSLDSVLSGQWDTIYHEHLRYYTPRSFERLLREHGMVAVSCEPIPTHGGSFRMMATLEKREPASLRESPAPDWGQVRAVTRATRADIRAGVASLGRVSGIGATARATTLLNFCGLDREDVRRVYEVPGSDKIGRRIPGTRIPIVCEDEIEPDENLLLLSWHMADVIVPKLREHGYLNRIFAPLPSWREVPR